MRMLQKTDDVAKLTKKSEKKRADQKARPQILDVVQKTDVISDELRL